MKQEKEIHRYEYSGPVYEFGECISLKWNGITMATSEAKAKTNLAFQYKKKHGKTPDAKIFLPNKLLIIE